MSAAAPQLRYSLRFLSGRNQGTEYVLADPSEVVVGRATDADLILIEGMVSRRHARFRVHDRQIEVEDLESTNGTFVNGEKVKSRRLIEADRVLIGTCILKVVLSSSPLGTKPPPPDIAALDEDKTANRYQVDGDISEISVPELLEMFSRGDRRAIIEIASPDGDARITVARGRVQECQSDRLPDAPAAKVMLRVLGLTKGTFAVRPYRMPNDPRVDRAIPELLVEGLFKLDELEVLRQRLPERDDKMVLARPMMGRLSALDETDLDLLQIAHNVGSVDDVLDTSSETDLETAKRLLALLDGGYLRRG